MQHMTAFYTQLITTPEPAGCVAQPQTYVQGLVQLTRLNRQQISLLSGQFAWSGWGVTASTPAGINSQTGPHT